MCFDIPGGQRGKLIPLLCLFNKYKQCKHDNLLGPVARQPEERKLQVHPKKNSLRNSPCETVCLCFYSLYYNQARPTLSSRHMKLSYTLSKDGHK